MSAEFVIWMLVKLKKDGEKLATSRDKCSVDNSTYISLVEMNYTYTLIIRKKRLCLNKRIQFEIQLRSIMKLMSGYWPAG